MTFLETLRAEAFARAPLAHANEAIAHQREARGGDAGPALSYELAPSFDVQQFLQTRGLPKLVYFLDCRGVRLPSSGGVFVSLFLPDELLFIDAGRFVELVAQSRGLTIAEAVRRYGDGGAGDPPLLGT
jgi:hypothetical protein